MVSEGFRRQLRREADRWQTEGLISPDQYQQLAQRYQFHALEFAARDRFVMILIGLGCLLLGLGGITFVAANWQGMSRLARVLLLVTVFVAVNAAGFYFWRRSSSRFSRLGHGLLLLGALLLGANMALMSQMFHLGGSISGLFIAWAVGVMAMAYSLRLTSLGVLSILLMGWGYWRGRFDGGALEEGTWLQWAILLMPLVAGVLFLPLAYSCRSRVLFGGTAIAVTTATVGTLLPALNSWGWTMAIVYTLPAALLWSYDDFFWQAFWRRQSPPADVPRRFQPIARQFAVIALAGVVYWGSFHGIWRYLGSDSEWALALLLEPEFKVSLLGIAVLLAVTVMQWVYLGRFAYFSRSRSIAAATPVMLGFLLVVALVSIVHLDWMPIPDLATFLFNVLLFLLGVGLVREGLAQTQRSTFWLGIVLLTLQILSRTLEYDTALVLKSLVFVLCGVGVIAAGLWFERYVQRFSAPAPYSSLPEETP